MARMDLPLVRWIVNRSLHLCENEVNEDRPWYRWVWLYRNADDSGTGHVAVEAYDPDDAIALANLERPEARIIRLEDRTEVR